MAVCLIVTGSRDTNLISLAAQFATAMESELIILEPIRRRNDPGLVEAEADDSGVAVPLETMREAARDFEALRAAASEESAADEGDEPVTEKLEIEAVPVTFRRLFNSDLEQAVLEAIQTLEVTLLLLPCHKRVKGGESLEQKLFLRAACETMYLRVPEQPVGICREILVPTVRSAHCSVALRRTVSIANEFQGTVTALYIEPAVDPVAFAVGTRILERVVNRAVGSDRKNVVQRVELAENLQSGVRAALRPEHQLVLLGASERRRTQRVLFGTMADAENPESPALVIGAVRAAIPFASRLRQSIERLLFDRVPQLEREERVSLVERVQSSSRWDFDFTALMCLSTLIAALGLVLNSAAVVIGAMLVAPLMTPLVGAGLSLVQGNLLLAKTAVRSVAKGFVLAFFIALVLGFVLRLVTVELKPTAEMKARTAPSVIDLVVAFVSGMAAAYAIGRPNLTSALPGVAIAAALVPPIATAGMYASLGEWSMSYGALLLFFTNIVAIVLATAFSLWLVGVRDSHQFGTAQKWRMRAIVLLGIVMVGLAVYESWPRVPKVLRTEFETKVLEANAVLRDIQREPRTKPVRFVVEVESEQADQSILAEQLLKSAEKHLKGEAEVELNVHLVRRSKP